jgi:D-alanyl-D-alanine-carboxypeptidase/D-alanyl-D-alanine-endopeptidase
VTREGDRLFVQATGQPKLEVFAYGERDFFYKVVDAQLTFEAGADGPATRVILHQNGHDVPGARVP